MLTRKRSRTSAAVAGAAALVVGLSGCGGGGSSPTSPSMPASAPTTTVLTQGTFTLASVAEANALGLLADAARQEFNVPGAGRLDGTVNWTFSSNTLTFGIYQGSCTFQLYYSDNCVELGLATPGKPARLTLNTSAGLHTIVILSVGTTSESGTFEVTLTR